MSDIRVTDKDSLMAFLDGIEQPRRKQAAVFIAARAALRAVPLLNSFFDVEKSFVSAQQPVTFRPLLISSAAATMPSVDTKAANAFATFAGFLSISAEADSHDDAADIANDLWLSYSSYFDADSDAFVTFEAHEGFDIGNYLDDAASAAISTAASAAHAISAAVSAVSAANEAFWLAAERDAGLWKENSDPETGKLSVDIAPLWRGNNPLDVIWTALQNRLRNDLTGADWSFWINWYQDILDGTKQDWRLLRHIATTDTIDWNAPAAEVNARINSASYRTLEELKRLKGEVDVLKAQLKNSQDEALAYEAKLKEKSAKEELSGVLDAWEDRAKSAARS